LFGSNFDYSSNPIKQLLNVFGLNKKVKLFSLKENKSATFVALCN